jgi:hypothetical protein
LILVQRFRHEPDAVATLYLETLHL